VWQSAAELARREGIYVVARSLRLDYCTLKKHVNGSGAVAAGGSDMIGMGATNVIPTKTPMTILEAVAG
jgi:hypothetical protein